MSNFVIGAFIVQLIFGAYLFSITLNAGRRDSAAHATGLPSGVVFFHPLLGLFALGCWIGWVVSDARPFAWVAFAALAVGATLGAALGIRTLTEPDRMEVPQPPDLGTRLVPADYAVAEKQIPRPALVGHGVMAVVLLACTLLVALGVFG